jgi:C-terminal processing protease CtpA/Prc
MPPRVERPSIFALALLSGVACAVPAVPGSIGVFAHREATGRVVLVGVPPGEAGARAGLEVGDELVAIEGLDVQRMSKAAVSDALRGPVGSKVTLDVRRDGLRHRIVVERGALRARPAP